MPTAVPTDLMSMQNQLIQCLHSGGEPSVGAEKLRQWIMERCRSELVSDTNLTDAETITCLDPSKLDTLELSDEALQGEMGLDEADPITNEMRLQFAVECLHSAYDGELSGGFASWCWPLVRVGKLEGSDGRSIVFGVLMRFQGPGFSYVPEWCEFFRDGEEVIGHLKQSGYITDTAPEDLDPRTLLNAWGYDE